MEILEKQQLEYPYFLSIRIGIERRCSEEQIQYIRIDRDGQYNFPEDLNGIIAFNDISIPKYMSPALSSIKIFTKFMGESAVDLFLERIKNGREICKKVVIPTKLKIRESCSEVKSSSSKLQY